MARAALSYASAASSAVSNVPSQCRSFVEGSRISAAYRPHGLRRTPRYLPPHDDDALWCGDSCVVVVCFFFAFDDDVVRGFIVIALLCRKKKKKKVVKLKGGVSVSISVFKSFLSLWVWWVCFVVGSSLCGLNKRHCCGNCRFCPHSILFYFPILPLLYYLTCICTIIFINFVHN